MIFPVVQELAADGVPVTVTCRVLKLCRQQYYRWLACPVSDAEYHEALVMNALFDAHRDDPEFGYRFLADEVRAAGHQVSDRTVWRMCRDMGWWSVFGKRKRGKGSQPGTAAHDDLVRRQFNASRPNQLWLADITEHPTSEGKLYCCAIKDVFSNRIVGWAISDRMKARLVVAAIEMAVARRGEVAGCILHSDSEYVGGRSLPSILTLTAMDAQDGLVLDAPELLDPHFRLTCCLSPESSVVSGESSETLVSLTV